MLYCIGRKEKWEVSGSKWIGLKVRPEDRLPRCWVNGFQALVIASDRGVFSGDHLIDRRSSGLSGTIQMSKSLGAEYLDTDRRAFETFTMPSEARLKDSC
jgi:hypothetical protein